MRTRVVEFDDQQDLVAGTIGLGAYRSHEPFCAEFTQPPVRAAARRHTGRVSMAFIVSTRRLIIPPTTNPISPPQNDPGHVSHPRTTNRKNRGGEPYWNRRNGIHRDPEGVGCQ